VRLAVKPVGKEGDLRDQFVALPDGTPFSLRLLLLDQRGGGKSTSGLSFNKLPDVARLIPLVKALKSLAPDYSPTPTFLAGLVKEQAEILGLPECMLTGKEIYDLFKKVQNNGGEDWPPKLDNQGRGRKKLSLPDTEESPIDG